VSKLDRLGVKRLYHWLSYCQGKNALCREMAQSDFSVGKNRLNQTITESRGFHGAPEFPGLRRDIYIIDCKRDHICDDIRGGKAAVSTFVVVHQQEDLT
jgi:hypothetical protein